MRKADVGLAGALFATAFALRIPFRSQFAYHWDGAQLARAVAEYNIRTNQPHPPGFYLYIVLARLLNFLVGEPHAALVWLSVIAGAWLVAVGYLLATSMFGRKFGLGTGLILLTSPLCWFHSEIALTTIVDSALVMSFVFACWRAIQRRVMWFQTVVLAVLLAAVAGVRQQSAPLLIPLWVYVFRGATRHRVWKFSCATALAAVLSLFWFVPTVQSAGGFSEYLNLLHLKSQMDAPRTVWGGGGVAALAMDAFCIGRACWVGLSVAGIISLAEFVCWIFFEKPTIRDNSYRANETQLCVLVLWIIPMLLFGMFMYVAMPGHILNFFPGFAVLTSLGLVKLAKRLVISSEVIRSWFFCCVAIVVVAVNAVVFIWSPRWTTGLLLELPLTGVEIHEHDADFSACFQTIRSKWGPSDVTICHRFESFYWGFAQFGYYLPEYRNVLLVVDTSPPGAVGAKKWIGYERRPAFQTEVSIPGGQDVLLVVPPGQSLDLFKSCFDVRKAVLVMESGAKLYQLHR